MCEKTKEKAKNHAEDDENSSAPDRPQRDYYYDDAHGYELYRETEDEEAVEKTDKPNSNRDLSPAEDTN